MRGRLLRARECYERALALSPRNGEAAYNLGLTLGALGDVAGAAELRARAAELGVGGP
jgi:Flp pilus assembly protein TadD